MNLQPHKNPPQALNLRGATLVITIKQVPASEQFFLEMAVVQPGHGETRTRRSVLSSRKCTSEAVAWMALRDLADGRVCDLAEIHMDPPEVVGEPWVAQSKRGAQGE